MAIVVTLQGTGVIKDGQHAWVSLSGLSAGDAIICVGAFEDYSRIRLYNSAQDTYYRDVTVPAGDVHIANVGNVETVIHAFLNLTASEASNIAYARFSDNFGDGTVAGAVYQVSGLATSSALDKSASATGSSTAGNSGATDALSQADELVIGGIGAEDEVDDMTGAWTTGASYVSGNEQENGTNGAGDASNITIYAAAEIVSATTAQTAEVTGTDNIDWAAVIATYKGSGVPPPTGQRRVWII